jgi:putative transposase
MNRFLKPSETELNLDLMREIDEQYLVTPFYGSRKMTTHLTRKGYDVNRKRIQRLMRLMGLEAIYRKPRLSQKIDARGVGSHLPQAEAEPEDRRAQDLSVPAAQRGHCPA